MLETIAVDKTRSFLPEEIQNLLLYWRDKFCQGYFEIGDIAAAFVGENDARGMGFTQQEIFNEIGKFCGKSGRTVRYYFETATFYPKDVRDRYSPLPFSHFVFARTVEGWRDVLEYALEHPYTSEDALRARFLAVPGQLPTGIGEDTLPTASGEHAPKPPAADIQVACRHRYMQAIYNLRDGITVIRELMSKMDEEERRGYEEALYYFVPFIDHLPKVIEKAV